jgi:hypothetical protein
MAHQHSENTRSNDPPTSGKGAAYPHVQRNDSGVSLEYSIDSSIMVGGDSSLGGGGSTLGGGSTIFGQHYATDASVNTTSSRGSRRVQANPSGMSKLSALLETQQTSTSLGKSGSFSSGMSLQDELTASWDNPATTPTDEELFAVGWAKALDPKSGSYYYFTLDRSKIVWDNPLAGTRRSDQSVDSESIPSGAFAI